MSWNSNQRSCKALYFSLQRNQQIDLLTEFKEAGELTMEQLLYFNRHASPELRRIDATVLAYRLDNEFTKIYKAGYEKDETVSSATLKLTHVLLMMRAPVASLSEVVNGCYQFNDEKNN